MMSSYSLLYIISCDLPGHNEVIFISKFLEIYNENWRVYQKKNRVVCSDNICICVCVLTLCVRQDTVRK